LSGRREPGYPLDDALCATTRPSRRGSPRANAVLSPWFAEFCEEPVNTDVASVRRDAA
jgi:hypothetical protein